MFACPEYSTTSATTTSAPEIDPVDGDAILILHDDKAMLHKWPRGKSPQFFNLRNGFNDFNAVFDFKDYWPNDACSIQFKGNMNFSFPK